MLLAINQTGTLVSVAHGLSYGDLNTVDKIIKEEALQVVHHTIDDPRIKSNPEVICRVEREVLGMPRFELMPIQPEQNHLRISYKIAATLLVNRWCARFRNRFAKTLPFQDEIYAAKLKEADAILQGNEGDVFYTSLDAERFNISIKEAAERIVAASLDAGRFLRYSEQQRIHLSELAKSVDNEQSFKSFRTQVIEALNDDVAV